MNAATVVLIIMGIILLAGVANMVWQCTPQYRRKNRLELLENLYQSHKTNMEKHHSTGTPEALYQLQTTVTKVLESLGEIQPQQLPIRKNTLEADLAAIDKWFNDRLHPKEK